MENGLSVGALRGGIYRRLSRNYGDGIPVRVENYGRAVLRDSRSERPVRTFYRRTCAVCVESAISVVTALERSHASQRIAYQVGIAGIRTFRAIGLGRVSIRSPTAESYRRDPHVADLYDDIGNSARESDCRYRTARSPYAVPSIRARIPNVSPRYGCGRVRHSVELEDVAFHVRRISDRTERDHVPRIIRVTH